MARLYLIIFNVNIKINIHLLNNEVFMKFIAIKALQMHRKALIIRLSCVFKKNQRKWHFLTFFAELA